MRFQIKISQGWDVSSASRSTPGLLVSQKCPGLTRMALSLSPRTSQPQLHIPPPAPWCGWTRGPCCVATARPPSVGLPIPVQTLQSRHPSENLDLLCSASPWIMSNLWISLA